MDFLFAIISAFGIGVLLIPQIIKIAHARNLHDAPDERKVHSGKIPALGGIGIFFGFIISLLVWSYQYLNIGIQYVLGGILVIFIIGIRDDLMPLSALWKLIGQIVAATIVILGGIRFHSLYGFLGVYEINDIVSYTISLYTIIVITNAFNLIDGIDGLAGTIGVIVFGIFGTWFLLLGNPLYAITCFSLLGGIMAFLRFNYSPAKIFMGDTGSLLLGFMASAMVLIFLQENNTLPQGHFLKITHPVTMVSAILVYPLFDTIRVFTIRILEGRSPFSPDRNHIHHLLLKLGYKHTKATFSIALANILFIVGVWFVNKMTHLGDNVFVPILVVIAFSIVQLLLWKINKKALE